MRSERRTARKELLLDLHVFKLQVGRLRGGKEQVLLSLRTLQPGTCNLETLMDALSVSSQFACASSRCRQGKPQDGHHDEIDDRQDPDCRHPPVGLLPVGPDIQEGDQEQHETSQEKG